MNDANRDARLFDALTKLLKTQQYLQARDELNVWNGEEPEFQDEIQNIEDVKQILTELKDEVETEEQLQSEVADEPELDDEQMNLLEEVMNVVETTGKSDLTLKEFRENSENYTHNDIYKHFDSWNEAKEMVGLTPNNRGGR